MSGFKKNSHALIAVYGDTKDKVITKALSLYLPDRDIRIMEPDSVETLEIAAQNSVLTFIALSGKNDPNFSLGPKLQKNHLISADIVGFCLEGSGLAMIETLSKGFDGCVSQSDTEKIEFKQYLAKRIEKGSRRLESMIQEEEYKRLSDALSIAPVSMIVFDADKRAVFVSDHYFRAYPRIAPRMIRGLRVYDAFEMMAHEEGIDQEDERYAKIRQFWHSLSGSIEFTLDNGTSYRLKAIALPSNRGTLVMGQNISSYRDEL
ncbi:MAG: hypothetical protein KDJ35_00210 [Alphaproteobacteria bacterium]|nr:hypothetical protein [Alphaproteobacteria bacterium]